MARAHAIKMRAWPLRKLADVPKGVSTADLKIVKRLQRMVIIKGEDGFDLVTSPAYVQLGPLCWQAIGRQLRDPALNLETKGRG